MDFQENQGQIGEVTDLASQQTIVGPSPRTVNVVEFVTPNRIFFLTQAFCSGDSDHRN